MRFTRKIKGTCTTCNGSNQLQGIEDIFGGGVFDMFGSCEFNCMLMNIGAGDAARNACIAACNPSTGNTYNAPGGGIDTNTILLIAGAGLAAILLFRK